MSKFLVKEERVCAKWHLRHKTADTSVDRLAEIVSVCIDETSAWMKSNRLQLNPTKTEVLWCSSSRHQHQIPTGPIQVGNTSVLPVSQVRDLGVYLDADATMTHCDRQEMFFGAVTDTQCAAFRATPRFADPDSVSRGQQCGLLQPGT